VSVAQLVALVNKAKLNIRLIKYDTFSEDVTKFYMAECILAIEAVHNLGFIHRQVAHSLSFYNWDQTDFQ